MIQTMRERCGGLHVQRHGAIKNNQQYSFSSAATDSGSKVLSLHFTGVLLPAIAKYIIKCLRTELLI